MWPELFSIFGIGVQSYGVSKALALLVGAYLLGRAFTSIGYDKELAHSIALWATVWGFVGAKVYFVLANLDNLSLHVLGGSGFVWYGGLVGGTLTVVVMTHRHGLSLTKVAGAMAMPLSVAYGVGRIGCFLSGDGTYGKPTDLPWGMAFPNGTVPIDVPVHPVPLYESLGAFAIAGVLVVVGRRLPSLAVFGMYLVLSGTARLLFEFIRINDRVLFGLTEAQLFGVASIALGALLIGAAVNRPGRAVPVATPADEAADRAAEPVGR
ncbi:prolipoprotein diacylglyceryl transferase [Tessaracoccus oleiagri]|uniref:Phosphatidylglycerol--prolipoprotein diacylglyceryl transferase n=1 Tax=Tessaracoccus oleiagri TaxID=686624 RepID=A0A1G9HGW3_9ACTN|nr:prolipoprotein diacylglyceryl transferase [Tessaracoccus oleiagri]SDL12220.1 phosphatidylglycerol:prolipoprotein diacylglycerol transferase [Tessaracoccus oleiagri]